MLRCGLHGSLPVHRGLAREAGSPRGARAELQLARPQRVSPDAGAGPGHTGGGARAVRARALYGRARSVHGAPAVREPARAAERRDPHAPRQPSRLAGAVLRGRARPSRAAAVRRAGRLARARHRDARFDPAADGGNAAPPVPAAGARAAATRQPPGPARPRYHHADPRSTGLRRRGAAQPEGDDGDREPPGLVVYLRRLQETVRAGMAQAVTRGGEATNTGSPGRALWRLRDRATNYSVPSSPTATNCGIPIHARERDALVLSAQILLQVVSRGPWALHATETGGASVMDFGPTPNPRNRIRILLVDDNVVFRAALRALLWKQRDLAVVGDVGTGEDAVACAQATPPDVVLMDLVMPGKGGVWAMRQLTALGVRAKVLVLTALSQEWELLEALEAGARGFVEKGGPVEHLVRAIRTVTKGHLFLDADGAKLAVLQRYLKETRSST